MSSEPTLGEDGVTAIDRSELTWKVYRDGEIVLYTPDAPVSEHATVTLTGPTLARWP